MNEIGIWQRRSQCWTLATNRTVRSVWIYETKMEYRLREECLTHRTSCTMSRLRTPILLRVLC